MLRFLLTIFGSLLGIVFQIGPGALAGYLGLSFWYPLLWGFALAFYSVIIKSNIGRGFRTGTFPPHYIEALMVTLPLSTALFSAINITIYWLFKWLSYR